MGVALGVALAGIVPAATAQAAGGVDGKDSTGQAIPAATQGAVAGQVVANTKGIEWTRCGGMQCATLTVPLDYANPAGGTMELTVSRRPADNPKQRIGVLVTNPGGPGVPASFTLPLFAQTLSRDIRARFDLIGINPRGTGMDMMAMCIGKPGQPAPEIDFMFPITPAQVQAQLAADAFTVALCKADTENNRILGHMSTGDSARDIDAVRAAMGEKAVNFYGVSYGSVLGATYTQLFPDRTRAVIVDGALDPVAWTGGRRDTVNQPMTARLGSHLGGQKALMSAIAECERVGARFCAEHQTIRKDWTELVRQLRKKPIELGDGTDGLALTFDSVIAMINGGLYDYEGVPDVLGMIHLLNQVATAGPNPPAAVEARAQRAYTKVERRDAANRKNRIGYDPPAPPDDEEQWPPMYAASFTGVVCDDGKQPSDPQAWVRAAKAADKAAPGFGSLWTWTSSVCAKWPFHSPGALRGAFNKPSKGGMLILNTTNDPATPYAGAIALRNTRQDSRLITVPGWGHAVLDTSGCASTIRDRYLLTGRLPVIDQHCRQDHALFPRLD